MAQSSKYYKIDEDILLEFVYHDQSNATNYDIDVDNNGSEIKVLSTNNNDYLQPRHLIHELGSDVVNFDVTESGGYVAIENFASRTLILEIGKTYKFDLSAVSNPGDFSITGTNNSTGLVGSIYTYQPAANGNFQYELTGFIGGRISVGNAANPLFATPDEETGNSIKTGANTIERYHGVQVSGNKYALLDSTNNFIDDPSVWGGTDSTQLAASQASATSAINHIRYDKVRLHLRNGFDFRSRGLEGFLFEVKVDRLNEMQNYLTQIVYLNTSNFEIKNPKPFIISETLYTSFIEIKVPSLIGQYQEFEDFFYGDGTVGSSNLLLTSNYNVSLKLIDFLEDNTSIDYFYTGEETNILVSREDEFQDFTVGIQEAEDGDYFEVFGEKDGSKSDFEQYIVNRNTTTGDQIFVIYEITVFEALGTSFIETSTMTLTKIADFDETIDFRPIIQFANNATAFAIDVVMKIYNQTTNTQIVKNASLTYNNAAKYGKRMMKVNIASTNNLTRIYNTLPNRQATRNAAQVLNSALPKAQVKYTPAFVERVNVIANHENVIPQDGTLNSIGQGDGLLSISPFDSYIKFTVSKLIPAIAGEDDNPENKEAVSFTNLKTVKLCFSNGMSFNNITSFKDIDMGNGELLFKISSDNGKKLQGESKKTYYISVDNGSTETLVYKGEYVSI